MRKLKNPAFWVVASLRIAGGLYFFVSPLNAWFIWIILDYLDSVPWRYFANLTAKEYESIDKYIDLFIYICMLLTAIGNQNFWIFLGLFLYRLVGQLIFSKNGNEKILILFPNIFEVYWLWAIAVPTVSLPVSIGFLITKNGLVILVFVKIIQEVVKHYIGPVYIFSKTTPFMKRAINKFKK